MTETVGVPSAEEVAEALGLSAETVAPTLAAEAADQASRCRVEPYTPALAQALVRRVKRARAMSAVPLGVQPDEGGGIRIGSVDPEVRRLEAPYRRVVLG